jgi:hypothetical protein
MKKKNRNRRFVSALEAHACPSIFARAYLPFFLKILGFGKTSVYTPGTHQLGVEG